MRPRGGLHKYHLALWIAQGETHAECAKRLGVSELAIAKRLKRPEIAARVTELETELYDRGIRQLTASATASIRRLEAERDNLDAAPADRIRAASVLLDKLLQARPPQPAGAPAGQVTLAHVPAEVFSRLLVAVRETVVLAPQVQPGSGLAAPAALAGPPPPEVHPPAAPGLGAVPAPPPGFFPGAVTEAVFEPSKSPPVLGAGPEGAPAAPGGGP